MRPNKSMLTVVVVMALVSFMCLSLSVSYSYVLKTKTSSNTVTITTENLNATITYGKVTSIQNLTDASGIGLSSSQSASINITKNNNYTVYYSINLSYAMTEVLAAGKTASDLVPASLIRVSLYKGTTQIMGPVALSDLPIYGTGDNNETIYNLAYGTFAAGSTSANYYVKIWLADGISESYDNKLVYLKANVNQETLVSKSLYTISGKVTNSSGTALSNATVSIQHGQSTGTSNSSGTYTLSNTVPSGLYNISVKYNNVEYRATINISDGTAVSVTSASGYNASGNSYNVVGIGSLATTSLPLNLKISGSTLVITKGS